MRRKKAKFLFTFIVVKHLRRTEANFFNLLSSNNCSKNCFSSFEGDLR